MHCTNCISAILSFIRRGFTILGVTVQLVGTAVCMYVCLFVLGFNVSLTLINFHIATGCMYVLGLYVCDQGPVFIWECYYDWMLYDRINDIMIVLIIKGREEQSQRGCGLNFQLVGLGP